MPRKLNIFAGPRCIADRISYNESTIRSNEPKSGGKFAICSGSGHAVIIGTVGKSAVIDRLIEEGKLDAGDLAGKREAFVIQTRTCSSFCCG
ncbi:hypothetical protein ACFQWB_07150 [Paenibacillus thermoaerophilus]|uniref:Uncharacterized protein n=1 Tax=Paenibacillus thermoaerophilus TaxID=1215385 RepID=A0ABW2V0M5_9BACL|nr:hypothetical protein [Paenibacillus thermoaerophilus]